MCVTDRQAAEVHLQSIRAGTAGGDLGPGRMRSVTSYASSSATTTPWIAGSLPASAAQQGYPSGVAAAGYYAAGGPGSSPFRAPSGLPRSSSPAGPLGGSLVFGSGASSGGAGSNRASFDSSTAASTGENWRLRSL